MNPRTIHTEVLAYEIDAYLREVATDLVVPDYVNEPLLAHLQQTARERKNTFEALMEAGKVCSLGSMSHALYDVGGEYRRNM